MLAQFISESDILEGPAWKDTTQALWNDKDVLNMYSRSIFKISLWSCFKILKLLVLAHGAVFNYRSREKVDSDYINDSQDIMWTTLHANPHYFFIYVS